MTGFSELLSDLTSHDDDQVQDLACGLQAPSSEMPLHDACKRDEQAEQTQQSESEKQRNGESEKHWCIEAEKQRSREEVESYWSS